MQIAIESLIIRLDAELGEENRIKKNNRNEKENHWKLNYNSMFLQNILYPKVLIVWPFSNRWRDTSEEVESSILIFWK